MASVFDDNRKRGTDRKFQIAPGDKQAAADLVTLLRRKDFKPVLPGRLRKSDSVPFDGNGLGSSHAMEKDSVLKTAFPSLDDQIRLDDQNRFPKSNFSFVFQNTGNANLFEECLAAEDRLFVNYTSCLIHARRALEILAHHLFANLLLHYGLYDSQGKACSVAGSIDQSRDTKANFNVRAQLKICLAARGQLKIRTFTDRRGGVGYVFSPVGDFDAGEDLVESLYQNASYYADHVNETTSYELCLQELQNLYLLCYILVNPKCPSGVLTYARLENLPQFDVWKVPYLGNDTIYYPIPLTICENLGIRLSGEDRLFAAEEESIRYFLFKKEHRRRTSDNRDSETLIRLWHASAETPENVLRDLGDIGRGKQRCRMFALPGRPETLSREMIGFLTREDKDQIIIGMFASIRTLHHFDPPMPHRSLNPDSFYICRSARGLRVILKSFETVKDFTPGAETVHRKAEEMQNLLDHNICIAPEIVDQSADNKMLTRADIFSLGKLMIYLYTGNLAASVDDPSIPEEYRSLISVMTANDPSQRPDIDVALKRFQSKEIKSVEFCSQSEIVKRKRQEDTLLFGNDIINSDSFHTQNKLKLPAVFAVFDGLGGESGGKEASGIAAQAVRNKMEERHNSRSDSPEIDYRKLLSDAFMEADSAVKRYKEENEIDKGGTTAVAAVVTEDAVCYGNIGDSRIYLFRDGKIRRLSEDHRLPSVLHKKGELYQYIGMSEDEMILEPHLGKTGYTEGDIVLLCSDGVTDFVTEEELEKCLTEAAGIAEASGEIMDLQKMHGGRDNASLILMRRC